MDTKVCLKIYESSVEEGLQLEYLQCVLGKVEMEIKDGRFVRSSDSINVFYYEFFLKHKEWIL